MIGVLDNTLNEIRFRNGMPTMRIAPASAALEKDPVMSVSKPGEVSLLIPGIDEIHQIDNH